jgi:hypothetical protein
MQSRSASDRRAVRLGDVGEFLVGEAVGVDSRLAGEQVVVEAEELRRIESRDAGGCARARSEYFVPFDLAVSIETGW